VVMHIDNSGRVARGGSLKGRDGPYRASHMWQLRIPFPDAPDCGRIGTGSTISQKLLLILITR
jgi:hypothetical protein